MDPISLADPANAPASMNIHTISMIFQCPAPCENIFRRSLIRPGVIATAYIDATMKAADTGTL